MVEGRECRADKDIVDANFIGVIRPAGRRQGHNPWVNPRTEIWPTPEEGCRVKVEILKRTRRRHRRGEQYDDNTHNPTPHDFPNHERCEDATQDLHAPPT